MTKVPVKHKRQPIILQSIQMNLDTAPVDMLTLMFLKVHVVILLGQAPAVPIFPISF